jgi:PEP-CTERM motif
MKILHLLTTASLAVALAGPALGSTIIAPTSGVVNSGGPGFGTLKETFNKSGLSTGYTAGVTNFDAYLASNPTHTTTFAGFEWFSNSGSNSAQVTYNFGQIFGIDRLALWNEEASGIGTLDMLSSLDGITFTSLGIFNPTNHAAGGSSYGADVFSFKATNAQFVRFTMSGCPQPGATFNSCAIGEVAFRTADVAAAVPEPATWLMMILGFGAIGTSMRRKSVSLSYA